MRSVVLVIEGPIGPGDVPALCAELVALLDQAEADSVVCDVRGILEPDIGTVDALARLALAGSRLGRPVSLVNVPAPLGELLVLAGLARTLCPAPRPSSAGRRRREAEEREETGGVEEERDPRDPSA